MPVECPKCHSENNDNSRFCSNCATPLSRAGSPTISLTRTVEAPAYAISRDSVIAGKYRIVDEVGAGGMGIVYKAEDLRLKRFVALKFLPPHLVSSPELRERFFIEAQAAAALSHPNICVIHEVGESDEHPYIAMEFVEGQTLKDRLRKGPLSAPEALAIASQVAAGLGEAHRKGIIHRDVKSANIMVAGKGQAKVMDFGLAKLQGGSSLTRSQTTLGTVAYMSPEQARGGELDARTDIWSLGVVLYEMLAGKMPFRGDHDQAVIYSILHDQPESLKKARPDAPPGVERVVAQALAKRASDRYRTMEEFRGDLEAVAEGLRPLKAKPRRLAKRILGIRASHLYAGLTAATALALVFAFNVGGLRSRIVGGPSARAVRLAVLPFKNLTGDAQQDYFSDGLTQEINTELGSLNPRVLSVIGNTSVGRYKKSNTPIDQIARDLRVEYVLEGGAQREGSKVRITAELIKTRDQTQVWAESLDREMSGILALQAEVTEKVAGALTVKLLPAAQARLAKVRTVDPEAYDAYIKGSQYWVRMTPSDLDTAERYFQLALQKDPIYAEAYAGTAWVWMCRNQNHLSPSAEAASKAAAAALKAVALDDKLAEAHFALAAVDTYHSWDLPAADREWRRAVEINPSDPGGLAMYSLYLMIMGRAEEGMIRIRKAMDLDPFNVTIQSFYLEDLICTRRWDEAIAQARKVHAVQPENPLLGDLVIPYLAKGMDKEAFDVLKKTNSQVPGMATALDRGLAEAGFRGAAKRGAETLAAHAGDSWFSPVAVANLYAWAEDKEHALDWLERGYESRDPDLPFLRYPPYDLLRSEARFQALMRKLQLVETPIP